MKKIGIAMLVFTLMLLFGIVFQIKANQVEPTREVSEEIIVNEVELEKYELTLYERIGH